MITKEILEEEIKKTKETIETINKLKEESIVKQKQIEVDCDVGLEINKFVLDKLIEKCTSI